MCGVDFQNFLSDFCVRDNMARSLAEAAHVLDEKIVN